MAQSGDSRVTGPRAVLLDIAAGTVRPVLPREIRRILGELSICLAFPIPLDGWQSLSKDGILLHRPLKLSFQWTKEFSSIRRVCNNLSFLQERENFKSKSCKELIHLLMPSPWNDHSVPPYSSAFYLTRTFFGRTTSKSPPPYTLSYTHGPRWTIFPTMLLWSHPVLTRILPPAPPGSGAKAHVLPLSISPPQHSWTLLVLLCESQVVHLHTCPQCPSISASPSCLLTFSPADQNFTETQNLLQVTSSKRSPQETALRHLLSFSQSDCTYCWLSLYGKSVLSPAKEPCSLQERCGCVSLSEVPSEVICTYNRFV